MSKHTPGPWHWVSKIVGGEDEDGYIKPGPIDVATFKSTGYYGNPELVDANGDEVVSAGGGEYMPYHGENAEQAIANARLIAAAPELLEALRAAVRLLRANVEPEQLGGERLDLTDCTTMRGIFSALAKAEGADSKSGAAP